MLTFIKTALGLTASVYDAEVQLLIDACLSELEMLGVHSESPDDDPQVRVAVLSYCKWRFGDNPNGAAWQQNYDDCVSKLIHSSLYQEASEYDQA